MKQTFKLAVVFSIILIVITAMILFAGGMTISTTDITTTTAKQTQTFNTIHNREPTTETVKHITKSITKQVVTTKIVTTTKTPTTTTVKSTTKPKEVPQVQYKEVNSYEIPQGTNFYAYMDYRTITDTYSPQYQLQQRARTNSQGIRCVGDDVCIALGSYYGTNIGDRYLIILDTGVKYTAILSDCKADIHTNYTNQYRETGNGAINIVEFVVDTNYLSYDVTNSGNIGTYSNYNGNVVSITKIL